MKMKLILVDLDETLLRSDKTISENTADVLKRCQKAGMLVGFCTSRGKVTITQWENQIQPDIVICNGGGNIYQEGKLIHTESFSVEESNAILSKAYEVCGKDAEITIDTVENIFWNRDTNKSEAFADFAKFHNFIDFPEPALKICVQTDDKEKATEIARSVEHCDYLPFSDIPWYKFSSSLATKENAIRYISEKLNISTEEMIAFGDDFNDIGMLKLCGKGIAMGNAIKEVKAVANDITKTNNEDGVAYYLEKNFLL